ncbi:MAG: STAS domain-containing protein [Candidatus Gracilibacteria bacterium]|nr:STAS domain-containing protein [Candidatus Gracilibacteria bacterium]MDD2908220.1 STAS domain-containing protein [Candidatus Gracilibacteria bacterium]
MKNSFFEITDLKGIQIIKILKTLEQDNVDKVFRQIEETINQKTIIIDLVNVGFINSTFIGYLFHLYETGKKSGRYICFVNGQDSVMDAFNLTGILDMIPYFKTLDEALIKLKK